MADNFSYDVFLSHSAKDKKIVRDVAERLKKDGLEVWFDEWAISAGDSIPYMIEHGLEHSRVLVLCMSANAFGSDWATLESHTFRFRDPLNKERRFIPLRLDDAEPSGSLGQFSYISWLPEDRQQAYGKLLEACRTSLKQPMAEAKAERDAEKKIQLDYTATIHAYEFSPDGKRALSGSDDKTVQLWDVERWHFIRVLDCLRVLEGHTGDVTCVVWSASQLLALSGSTDQTLRLWDMEGGNCIRILEGHTGGVYGVAASADHRRALSGSGDKTVRLWDLEKGRCLRVFEGHTGGVNCVTWSSDQLRALSGSGDKTVRLWDMETGRCLRVLEGHTGNVSCLALSPDQRRALSGSGDKTMRLWEVETGRCLRVFEGHTGDVSCVKWSSNQRFALSGSSDKTVRLWDVETGRCLRILEGHPSHVVTVAWNSDQQSAYSGDSSCGIRVWNLSKFITEARSSKLTPNQVQYTNAKVLLVGESGAGKTGLSKVLAGEEWQPSDSTVGAWATQWKLPLAPAGGVEREIWLWDFGGQADQRLIHQLYMDETSLMVLVFDGQREDLFETLGQWDRDLTRASRTPFSKLLVAGRVDAGGLRVSRSQVEAFVKERGYTQFLETSAKKNICCDELKEAIFDGIRWENIPWRSTPLLFKRLKEEIVRLKDAGRVLMRFNELRETLQLRLSGEFTRFTDEELKAVVSLLAGPGVVWELKFGSWVLLQPERINAYAQAVIQTMRADKDERGCLPEERVLNGRLTYHSSMPRLEVEEERFVLLAMHQTLVERGLCLREHTDEGPLLVFPSYYRRERQELVSAPAVLVSYRFNGFLDDIYATLVVRLHHTNSFNQDQLWRYAADFKTLTGKQLGVKLTRRAEGAGELEVYFDPAIGVGEKIIFSKYVHEHLLQNAKDVLRLRYYACPHCGTPVGNREVAMKRLDAWLEKSATETSKSSLFKAMRTKREKPTIVCSECERRVPLWDDLEQHFASPETKQQVREMEQQSDTELDNESQERALVGEVISTVVLAGQLSREFNVSDQGIDMEIEFKSDAGEPTGLRVYLQLKSGNSYVRERQGDGTEVFTVKDEGHACYWVEQPFPVVLVMRNASGEVCWMEVSDYLRRASDDDKTPVKKIIFEGERFDVMSVRGWREKALRQASTPQS